MTTIEVCYTWYEVIYKDKDNPHRCQPAIRHFNITEKDKAIEFLNEKSKYDQDACLNLRSISKTS